MFLITLNLNSFILSTLSVTGRHMFSNVYFICIEYKLQLYKKRVTYSNIYHKVVTKSADAKIKIGVIKNHDMDWLVQMLTWLQKSFKNAITAIKNIQGYHANQIIPCQMHQ